MDGSIVAANVSLRQRNEDNLIRSKAQEQLLNEPCHEIIHFSAAVSMFENEL